MFEVILFVSTLEPKKPEVIEKLKQQRKARKQLLKEKRARLIVRNLPFAATEENLRKHYEQFGEVANVTLLKKPDGKLVGCGFIQFQLVQKAAKARHHTNGKPFLGREIICDWALAKDKFEHKTNENKPEIKKEDDIVIKVEIKEEPEDTSEQLPVSLSTEPTIKTEPKCELEEVKEENVSDEEADQDVELSNSVIDKDNESEKQEEDIDEESEVENEVAEEEDAEEKEEAEDTEEEEEEDTDDEVKDIEKETEELKKETSNEAVKKPHVSNDVTEGRTVFIKNVPFSATNDDLKECMSQFGPVFYALVCIDKFTEHSRGTAFVKFRVSIFF